MLERDEKDRDKETERGKTKTDECRDRMVKNGQWFGGASGYRGARQTEGMGHWEGHLGKRKGTSQTEGNGHQWEGLSGDIDGDRL